MMGLFQKLAIFLGVRKKEVNVLVVGLNNSGKTTVVNSFKNEDDKVNDIVPTVGFSVERFQSKSYYHHYTTGIALNRVFRSKLGLYGL